MVEILQIILSTDLLQEATEIVASVSQSTPN